MSGVIWAHFRCHDITQPCFWVQDVVWKKVTYKSINKHLNLNKTYLGPNDASGVIWARSRHRHLTQPSESLCLSNINRKSVKKKEKKDVPGARDVLHLEPPCVVVMRGVMDVVSCLLSGKWLQKLATLGRAKWLYVIIN